MYALATTSHAALEEMKLLGVERLSTLSLSFRASNLYLFKKLPPIILKV